MAGARMLESTLAAARGAIGRWLGLAALAALVAANLLVPNVAPHFGLDGVTGFFAAFALAGAFVLGCAARSLDLLRREEQDDG